MAGINPFVAAGFVAAVRKRNAVCVGVGVGVVTALINTPAETCLLPHLLACSDPLVSCGPRAQGRPVDAMRRHTSSPGETMQPKSRP